MFVQIRSVHQSLSSLASLRGWFHCLFDEFSLLFCFMLLTQIMHNYVTWLLRSPLARALYIILFNLTGIYVLCVCTKKSLRSPRTHFRACKISRGCAPRPRSHNPFCGAPLFVFALGLPNPLGGPVHLGSYIG